MGDQNVVSILVKANNDTKAGFDESKAGAEGAGAATDEYAAAVDRASAAEQEFRAAQAEADEALAAQRDLQQSGTASADELAAAQDRVTTATLASLDAQKKLADADGEVALASKASGDAAEESAGKADAAGGMFAGAGAKLKMAGIGAAIGIGLAVKAGMDFQQQTVKLVTSAGESAKNLGMVQAGILAISSSTATSSSQLASGMYMIESAGFHGAAGLTVLKAAAEGAKAEGADLGEVANAVTSGLNAYGLKAQDATSFTDMMVRAVGQGKMTMQDLASSLSAVLPIAASAHISFAQVGGAVATMTGMGMSARQATQDLAGTIRSLISPSSTSSAEMRALGLNANDVARNLGKVGLTGTMQDLTEAILRNTSGGNVLLGYMHEMSPAAQGLARQILAGTISTKQLRTAVYGLNPEQAKLISLFDTSATSATGLKQTFTGAMKEMTGGATGMNVALMLTGSHSKTFADNVAAIGGSAKGAGKDVAGWNDITKETSFQLAKAKDSIMAAGTSLGLALLPAVTAIITPLASFLSLIAHNRAASIALAVVVGGVLAGALGGKLAGAFKDVKSGVEGAVHGIEKLTGLLRGQASQAEKTADASKKAAGEEEAASDKAAAAAEKSAGKQEEASAKAAGAAETAAGEEEAAAGEAAAANEEAAAESSSSWLASMGQQIAAAAAWVAETTGKIATVVAENVSAAASTAGSWIAAGASQLASGAAWVAESVAKVAVVVGTNIAGALSTAAAWVAANAAMTLGIAAVVALVVVAVVEIIKHWKSIVHGVEEAFDDVKRAVTRAVDDVVGFVKSHWQLLLMILIGPIALAVYEIVKHWDTIKRDTEKFADDVRHDVAALADDVLHFFERMFDEVVGTAARWYDSLIGWVRRTFDDFINREVSGLDNIVHWFEGLPRRILSAVGDLGSLLTGAGERVIQGLIHGITSQIGSVGHAIGSVVGEIKNFLPFSPAKKGPLSGAGAPENSGRSIPRLIAQGLMRGVPDITSAMEHVTGAVNPRGGYAAYGAGGAGGQLEVTLRWEKSGDKVMDAIGEGIRIQVRDKGGGGPDSVQKTYGRVS